MTTLPDTTKEKDKEMDRRTSIPGGKIPRPVRLFFIKALVLFVLWKAVYLLFLLPHRTLDEPLTHSVGWSTAHMLNLFSQGRPFSARETGASLEPPGASPEPAGASPEPDGEVITGNVMDIYRGEDKTLRIADACNGLELFVLYAGFIIAFPARVRRKSGFIAAGFFLIYLINTIRCAILVEIFLHYHAYLDFSHHYLFTFIVYSFIFLLWWRFTKNQQNHGRLA